MKQPENVSVSKYNWRHYLGVFLLILITRGTWWYFRHPEVGNVADGLTSNALDILQSTSGRTNVAFLGIGGEGHSGSDLTDSIILFSYHHDTRSISLIPIPRDVWIESMKAKVNTAYHYGNENNVGGGMTLAKQAVSEVVGMEVHYVAVLDFAGFEKLIDIIGGIDLVVDNSFDDYKYPIPGKETALPESERYEHVSFKAGQTHMDGALALKFARSRHALGDEGTDFARSKRQEKVIAAFKDKILSTSTLFNLQTLQNIRTAIADSLDTDIGDTEAGAFIRLFLSVANNSAPANSLSLVDLFYNPQNLKPYAGQWVLIPKISWEDVHAFIAQELAGK